MGSLVDTLISRQLISPPPFIKNNIQYEVIMGSVAYGVSSDTSDMDIYGFCVPPKYIIFPHLNGEIAGFGRKPAIFDQWEQHHIIDKSSRKEYDFSIYSIVKYFHLCMENNPNMIDSLFVPRRCILHSTQVGEHIREHRKDFLHKGSWHRFKGYAYSQVHKMNTKEPDKTSTRYAMIQQYGFDVKFAYHVVRLLNEVEQIMIEHDLDLQRNREQLKSIRKGEWTKKRIINYFEDKEKSLEELYLKSDLPHSPDEEKIKKILLECLEMHYGSLEGVIKTNISIDKILDNMSDYIQNIRMMNK
jgi:predicted nucleotidyltransferase